MWVDAADVLTGSEVVVDTLTANLNPSRGEMLGIQRRLLRLRQIRDRVLPVVYTDCDLEDVPVVLERLRSRDLQATQRTRPG